MMKHLKITNRLNAGLCVVKMALKIITAICFSFCLLACADPPPPAPIVDGWQQRSAASIYRVQPDDTIYSVAWMFGMDYRDIARYNNLSEPYTLSHGQALKLTPSPDNVSADTNANAKAVTYPAATIYTPPAYVDAQSSDAVSVKNTQTEPSTKTSAAADTSSSNQPVSAKEKTVVATETSVSKTALGSGKWKWPVKGEIVKGFSAASGGNRGIDISSKLQTPIVATASGKVVYTGSSMPGYGRLVIIKHDNNDLSAYAFNESILVKEGEAVKAGQQIATMGKNNEGVPMLHFEVRHNGKPQNPLLYLEKA
ncbi:MAG: nlpD [Gammaproteobacteria bacterium]|jgi:lipoprotein NlpD|nr:nlpD [Gammaproteobacteria bacterium]